MARAADDPFFFWALVPPVTAGKEDEVEAFAAELDGLGAKAEQGEDIDEERVHELVASIEERSANKCALARAPLVGARPDFKAYAKEIYDEEAVVDEGTTLEEFEEMLSKEPDCEACEAAQIYGHPELDPCEITPMLLTEMLRDPALIEAIDYEMDGEGMIALADGLQGALDAGAFQLTVESVEGPFDPADYLKQTIRFLRTWGERGFHLAPIFLDPDEDDECDDHGEGCGCH